MGAVVTASWKPAGHGSLTAGLIGQMGTIRKPAYGLATLCADGNLCGPCAQIQDLCKP